MRVLITLLMVVALLGMTTAASASTKVFSFDNTYTADGQWYRAGAAAGTMTMADLTGEGGDLENNQPLPIGAALLKTGLSNLDKGEIQISNQTTTYGLASAVLNAITLQYSYYKKTVGGGNIFGAPSIKLTLFGQGTGDNFGSLVYEPSWNQAGGGSQAPPADAWQHLTILHTDGAGDDASGGWWWTGGFEIPSGAGGPPIRSLAEWATAFAAADPVDFPGAVVFIVSIGVGTFNQGQCGYVDNVVISNTADDGCYDFEPEPTVRVEETTWGAIKALYSSGE